MPRRRSKSLRKVSARRSTRRTSRSSPRRSQRSSRRSYRGKGESLYRAAKVGEYIQLEEPIKVRFHNRRSATLYKHGHWRVDDSTTIMFNTGSQAAEVSSIIIDPTFKKIFGKFDSIPSHHLPDFDLCRIGEVNLSEKTIKLYSRETLDYSRPLDDHVEISSEDEYVIKGSIFPTEKVVLDFDPHLEEMERLMNLLKRDYPEDLRLDQMQTQIAEISEEWERFRIAIDDDI